MTQGPGPKSMEERARGPGGHKLSRSRSGVETVHTRSAAHGARREVLESLLVSHRGRLPGLSRRISAGGTQPPGSKAASSAWGRGITSPRMSLPPSRSTVALPVSIAV